MYRGWTQVGNQNTHYNINQKDKGTQDDRGRDGGTNFILRIKEQETRLTLQEHDGGDDYDVNNNNNNNCNKSCVTVNRYFLVILYNTTGVPRSFIFRD